LAVLIIWPCISARYLCSLLHDNNIRMISYSSFSAFCNDQCLVTWGHQRDAQMLKLLPHLSSPHLARRAIMKFCSGKQLADFIWKYWSLDVSALKWITEWSDWLVQHVKSDFKIGSNNKDECPDNSCDDRRCRPCLRQVYEWKPLELCRTCSSVSARVPFLHYESLQTCPPPDPNLLRPPAEIYLQPYGL